MSECKRCGKTYFSKACPHCNNSVDAQRKERYKRHMHRSKAKGDDYEAYVAEYFRNRGYSVAEHGKINGVNDQSIDLILKKENQITLVQCKNYRAETKYKIDHEKIKAFVGETAFYLQDNPMYEGYELKRLYVVSNPVLDKSAIHFINNHKEKIDYLHLPFRKPLDIGTPSQKMAPTERAASYQDRIKKRRVSDGVSSENSEDKDVSIGLTLLFVGILALAGYIIVEYKEHQQTVALAEEKARVEKLNRERQQREQKSLAQEQRMLELAKEKARATKLYRERLLREREQLAQQRQKSYTARYSSTTAYRATKVTREKPKKQKKASTITRKMYPKYTEQIKLKSYSKISVLPDNRLTSNSPIYGIFEKRYLFSKPKCREKQLRDIGLVNDCYVMATSRDKLYIKKSRVKEFSMYNKMKNKKIECDYSKKYGIMHDCKIWNG